MADWSHLPKELLQLISEKLNSDFYILRFRSVCSTWRLSIPKPQNHFPLKLPHFHTSYKNDSVIHTVSKHSIFLIKPPATPNQKTLYLPWLVRICRTSTGKFNLWHPLLSHHLINFSHLDFNQLSVFEVGQMYTHNMFFSDCGSTFHSKSVIVAKCQGRQPLDIITQDKYGELMMFRCGDDHWTEIPNVAKFPRDICIFKGRRYVIDGTGRAVMIGSDLSVHLVAEPVSSSGNIKVLVESEFELLLVDRFKRDGRVKIDVFRLDEKEKKWVKLANLGHRVLILGADFSLSASTSDLGFDNGNFVIYINGNGAWEDEMNVFHLERGQLSVMEFMEFFKLFEASPEWLPTRVLNNSDRPPIKYVYKRKGKKGNVNEMALVLEGQLAGKEIEICEQEARITECTDGKPGFEDHDWYAKENPINKGQEKKARI